MERIREDMEKNYAAPENVDAYIAGFPPEIQTVMEDIRKTIRKAAPAATEKISWGMATFFYHGNLVHFAGNKNHLGFYPGANGVANFAEELKEYKTSKGAIQFPYNKPLPHELIFRIVTFRMAENEALAKGKSKK